ncbi:MAG: hypothetical protein ACRD5B_04970 [Nitrososphaeraceae archaeon]
MKAFFGKTEADWLLSINVYWLNQNGYFNGIKAGTMQWARGSGSKSSVGVHCYTLTTEPYMRLKYSQSDSYTNKQKEFDYKVRLTTTPCNYGGKRWWFVCPLMGCGRRVGTLYKNGGYFGCRHCHDLTYASKNIDYRNGLIGSLKILSLDKSITELEAKITRRFYAGKLTKKQKKLDKLYASVSRVYNVNEIGKLL